MMYILGSGCKIKLTHYQRLSTMVIHTLREQWAWLARRDEEIGKLRGESD